MICGTSVRVKPDPADVMKKTEIPANATFVKRREYTYRPPAKAPEVVLVMPPVDKPIITREVRARHFKCTKDGKYKSLGRAPDDAYVNVKDSHTKGTSIESYEVNNDDQPSHEEILQRMNAKLKGIGNIHLRLPVVNVDGQMSVQLPVANVEGTGNIHVHLPADSLEDGDTRARLPMESTPVRQSNPAINATEPVPVENSLAGPRQSCVNIEPETINLEDSSEGPDKMLTNSGDQTPLVVTNTVETITSEINAAGPIITSVRSLGLANSSEFHAEPFNSALSSSGLTDSESLGPSTTEMPASDSVALSIGTNTLVMPSSGLASSVAISTGTNTSVMPSSELASSVALSEEPSKSIMPSSGPVERSVSEGAEFSAIPLTPSFQHVKSVIINNGPNYTQDITAVMPETVKPKKRKMFDKSRYTAFEKSEETSKLPEKIPKKPKLYSLNPFCVPISLLDISK